MDHGTHVGKVNSQAEGRGAHDHVEARGLGPGRGRTRPAFESLPPLVVAGLSGDLGDAAEAGLAEPFSPVGGVLDPSGVERQGPRQHGDCVDDGFVPALLVGAGVDVVAGLVPQLSGPHDLGLPFLSEQLLQKADLLMGEGGAHRHGHRRLVLGGLAQPGTPVAGHRLEFGPKAGAPLLDQVCLVDDEVLQQSGFGGVLQGFLQRRHHRFGGGEQQALATSADVVAYLPLDLFRHAAGVGITAGRAPSALPFKGGLRSGLHVQGKNDRGDDHDGHSPADAGQQSRGLGHRSLAVSGGQAHDRRAAGRSKGNGSRGLLLPNGDVLLVAEGLCPIGVGGPGFEVSPMR